VDVFPHIGNLKIVGVLEGGRPGDKPAFQFDRIMSHLNMTTWQAIGQLKRSNG
jgi:hypothetical protein